MVAGLAHFGKTTTDRAAGKINPATGLEEI